VGLVCEKRAEAAIIKTRIKKYEAPNPEGLTFTIWQAGRLLFKDLKAEPDHKLQEFTNYP